MGSTERADGAVRDTALLRDALAIGAAAGVIGLSFGAIAVAGGLPLWAPVLMSLVVFAGGSQFLAVAFVAASPVAAVLGGILVNARHLPFGLAVGGSVGDTLGARLLGSHLLIDESTAFALAQRDPARSRRAFWAVGIAIFLTWNIGTVAGALLGGAVGDPAVYGLDAAFPAGLLALLMASLKDRPTRYAALAGAAIAVLTTPLLPAGLPVLVALAGVGAALLVPTPRPRTAAAADPERETV
ncbi:branched-chain amino acid ABC transporter permease [Catellatospora sp. TT07R-123]|uniref:AzlC family ABC transporter permease n=1 Tax=Catellatospora sp. TT07R-123 TaxID=2733863 RepID=UPI001B04BE94|nr:AzlC family ABC transporter permease [Catellatospora sp. TT07R-123]GHJ45065.1 branched-chain amino acid ABC transporter permease [Catellatospora sp. TT07R-123]